MKPLDAPPAAERTSDGLWFDIPGRPVGKGAPRFTGKVVITDPKSKAWMKLVSDLARRVAPPEPWTGPVEVTIVAYFAIGERPYSSVTPAMLAREARHATSKPDADNISKGIGDALTGIVWKDDCQVVRLAVVKALALEAKTFVRVRRLAPEPTQTALLDVGPKRRRRRNR